MFMLCCYTQASWEQSADSNYPTNWCDLRKKQKLTAQECIQCLYIYKTVYSIGIGLYV